MRSGRASKHPLAAIMLLASLIFLPFSLWAHAQQEGAYPEHEAVVEGTPEKIAVWFDHAMRITLFEVTGPDGAVELAAQPGRAAVSRFETTPAGAMPPGEYTVRWRGSRPGFFRTRRGAP